MDLMIFILSVHIDALAGKWYVSDSITVTVAYGHCIRIQSTKNLQKSADICSENQSNSHEWRICEGTGGFKPTGPPGHLLNTLEAKHKVSVGPNGRRVALVSFYESTTNRIQADKR